MAGEITVHLHALRSIKLKYFLPEGATIANDFLCSSILAVLLNHNFISFFSFFLIWGDTRSLRMLALRPASQAGPMRNPREGTSVVLRDTTRLTNLMVCVVCSCCATSPYREVCRAKGGIGSGETLCHDIYPARLITTVSLAANTYCMMDGHSSCAPRAVDPRVQFSGACEQGH